MAVNRHVQFVHTTGPTALCEAQKNGTTKEEATPAQAAARKKYQSLMLNAHPVELPSQADKTQLWNESREFGHESSASC